MKLPNYKLPVVWLFVLLAICAGLLDADWVYESHREQQAAVELKHLGATVHYAWRLDARIQLSPQRAARRTWHMIPGDGFVDGVEFAGCRGEILENQLAPLASFGHLRWLNLTHAQITDAAVQRLSGLSSLEWLDLSNTPISDDALTHLRQLNHLKWLDLGKTLVTDASLPHLAVLKQLEMLDLSGTRVTAGGLALFRNQLPAARIETGFGHACSASRLSFEYGEPSLEKVHLVVWGLDRR